MTPAPPSERLEELTIDFERVLADYLAEVCAKPVANLHDAMTYALGADIEEAALRGKRLRPALCLLAAESLGADLERAYPFALAIELMHNFCLVHDDIEDGDRTRRGRPSVWVRYGLPHAINVGDFLLVHTQRALTKWGSRKLDSATRFELLALLARALEHTHVGQSLDINARTDRAITIERYYEIVREKTGHYLAAPIQGGALVAGANEKVLDAIGGLAMLLGPMFQIVDDVIDLTEGKGREAVGSDIREGKRSFMVAHGAARAASAERERLFDILDSPRDSTTESDVEWVIDLFGRTGSVEAGRDECDRLFEQSKAELASLPAPLAEALLPVLESLTRRRR